MSRPLTPREIEGLILASDGVHSSEIARLWGYHDQSKGSGASHVRRFWKQAEDKLGADTITQAVAMAIRRGLIE